MFYFKKKHFQKRREKVRKSGMWYEKALLKVNTESLSTANDELSLSPVLLEKKYSQEAPSLALGSKKCLTEVPFPI